MAMDYPGLAADITVELANSNVPAGTGALSITGWVNPDADGTADDQVIIAKSNTTGNGGAFKVQIEEPGNVLRGIINGDELTGVGAVSPGVWTFFAMVYDGANKTLFLNAVQDATEADVGGNIGTDADPLRLGGVKQNGGVARELDGLLDDIRVYTRALSLAELQTIFNSLGVDGIVFGLHWRWVQNELSPGTAAVVVDSIIDLAGTFDGDPINSPVYAEGILRI